MDEIWRRRVTHWFPLRLSLVRVTHFPNGETSCDMKPMETSVSVSAVSLIPVCQCVKKGDQVVYILSGQSQITQFIMIDGFRNFCVRPASLFERICFSRQRVMTGRFDVAGIVEIDNYSGPQKSDSDLSYGSGHVKRVNTR